MDRPASALASDQRRRAVCHRGGMATGSVIVIMK
jgi:hypothetical protein